MDRSNFSRFPTLLAGTLLLAGCAAMNDATLRAFSTTVPAWAVLGERVLAGEVRLYPDRSATLELRDDRPPSLSCMGTMPYTSSTGGTLSLRCSDGSQVQLPYIALGETSGQGSSRAGTQTASFAYGLAPQAARAWLVPPPGKRLTVSGDALRLD